MKRRDFIKMSAGLGAAMATTTPLSPAFAQAKTVLKAADVHPLGYPTVEAVLAMGKKLEAATNGRLSIQMFPSMQLGGEKEMIEQAQLGALQIARISVGAVGPVVDDANVGDPLTGLVENAAPGQHDLRQRALRIRRATTTRPCARPRRWRPARE